MARSIDVIKAEKLAFSSRVCYGAGWFSAKALVYSWV